MKLTELLIEGVLDIYRTQLRLSLNAQDYNDAAVIELKRSLARHALVMSMNPKRVGGSAWTGPINGEWTPALNNAIVEWKKSINRQVGRPILSVGPSIQGSNDIDFLLYKRLSNNGTLAINNQGNIRSDPSQAPSFKGRTYQHGKLGDVKREDVIDTKSFIEGIGFSGWMIILNHLAMEKYEKPTQRETEIKRMMPIVESSYQLFPDKWRNRWVQEVVRSQTQAKATLGTGETMSFVPPVVSGGPERAAKALYDYFSKMAVGLFQLEEQQRQEKIAQQQSVSANQPQMNAANHTAWAQAMHEALENKFIAIVTSRDVDNDIDSVNQLFMQLKTAADYDAVEAAYKQQFNEDLQERLVEELDDDEYLRIVRLSLESINRIAPIAMLDNIQFGEQASIEVTHVNKNYTINKELQNNAVVVLLNNKPIKNAILEDAILKVGIQQTGGTVPDLNIEVDDITLEDAKFLFVDVLDTQYPEMVAWYTNQAPFDEMIAVPFGDRMAIAKTLRGAKYLQNGMTEANLKIWYEKEVKKDREFLIGTADDPDSAAVNIYFDPKYESEGARGRAGIFTTTLDDEAEISEEEMDLIDRLHTNDEEEFNDAVEELVSLPDAASRIEDMYRTYDSLHGEPFENAFGGEDAVIGVLEGTLEPDAPMNKLLGVADVTLPMIATITIAKLFKDSIDGWQSGSDRDRMKQIIAQIRNKADYDRINEEYRSLGGAEDLLEDLYEEENTLATGFGWFNNSLAKQLSKKIGKELELDIRRSELPPAVIDSLRNLQEEPTLEHAKILRTRTNSIKELDRNQAQIILEYIDIIINERGEEVEPEVREELKEFVNEVAEIVRVKDDEWYDKWFYERWWKNFAGWFD